MIPRDTIEQIIHATRIEEVVGTYVKLSRKGSVLTGNCPFHQEKTPSFTVSPSKNIFKCFGCGEGGDAIHFLQKHKNISFIEAIKELGAKYQVEIPEREQTDEERQQTELHEQIRNLYHFAAAFYQTNLPQHTEAHTYIQSRLSAESIDLWKIGYAPDTYSAFVTHAISNGYTKELLLQSKLVKQSDKDGALYDFFLHRIIFPITDKAGRITSFAGRAVSKEEKVKYINLAENDLYHKRELLYGFIQAVRAIREQNNVYIVEGYTDVIRMHELGFVNTVASSGTAFTVEQLNLLKKNTAKLTLLLDGDKAGLNAAMKAGKTIIENKLHAYIVPLQNGKDPADAWQTPEEAADYINGHTSDFVSFMANDLIAKAGQDPMAKNTAITQIAELIINFDKTTRELYTANISKQTKLKSKLLSDKLKDMEVTVHAPDSETDFSDILPDGVDPADYEKYGFYCYKNEYYFRTSKGHEKMSNFKMTPIFHVNSINESKRIFELENRKGARVVVDLDMQEMTSVQAFQRNIEGRGNFLFYGQLSQFAKIKLKLYEETKTCNEIRVLGWQKEGFWAWSNGIITETGFQEVDEYGVVDFNDETYFIPAFSKIYINDKSIFVDERRFKYGSRGVTLNDWSLMFMRVFGNNAMIGIAYWVATLFRDQILRQFQNFPLLNLFGPKGTGKSQMAVSLCYLFGEKQTPFNIHNGTKPGLAEHLQQFNNAFAWVDEYKNNIEYDKIETLKSIYDAIGRSRMNMDKGRKKETTNVNAGVILSGQEMPTADVALFSRVVFLQFNQSEFTDTEKSNYDKLKNLESGGLSHLSSMIIQKRKHFEDNYYEKYQETLTDFNEHFANNPVEDRIMRSVVGIIAAWRTISSVISFPFTYSDLLEAGLKSVEFQNSQISKSNEIGMFWNILESMFDENIIVDKWHFRVDYCDDIKTKTHTITLKEPMEVLKFKYNTIYSAYSQQSRKQGLKPLPPDTLQYYLRNHKAFLAIQDQTVFVEIKYDVDQKEVTRKTQNTSAMCFNYSMLNINLIRENDLENSLPTPLPNYDPKYPF
jgi:DNA primase